MKEFTGLVLVVMLLLFKGGRILCGDNIIDICFTTQDIASGEERTSMPCKAKNLSCGVERHIFISDIKYMYFKNSGNSCMCSGNFKDWTIKLDDFENELHSTCLNQNFCSFNSPVFTPYDAPMEWLANIEYDCMKPVSTTIEVDTTDNTDSSTMLAEKTETTSFEIQTETTTLAKQTETVASTSSLLISHESTQNATMFSVSGTAVVNKSDQNMSSSTALIAGCSGAVAVIVLIIASAIVAFKWKRSIPTGHKKENGVNNYVASYTSKKPLGMMAGVLNLSYEDQTYYHDQDVLHRHDETDVENDYNDPDDATVSYDPRLCQENENTEETSGYEEPINRMTRLEIKSMSVKYAVPMKLAKGEIVSNEDPSYEGYSHLQNTNTNLLPHQAENYSHLPLTSDSTFKVSSESQYNTIHDCEKAYPVQNIDNYSHISLETLSNGQDRENFVDRVNQYDHVDASFARNDSSERHTEYASSSDYYNVDITDHNPVPLTDL